MSTVLFTVSVTGWLLVVGIVLLGLIGAWQAHLMGIFNRNTYRHAGVHLLPGLKYTLKSGSVLRIEDVCPEGREYALHRGTHVRYVMNGDVSYITRQALHDFLKENMVTDEDLSED
tara:strand:+ start:606 stop:953 length:348 start_codon:yes stop_codon:yes gene_type:complete